MARLSPVGFGDLPGWDRDRVEEALPAIARSCARILRLPDHGLLVLPFWNAERAPNWREDAGGLKREFWVMPYQDYYIWGATAGMLVNLCEVLRDAG